MAKRQHAEARATDVYIKTLGRSEHPTGGRFSAQQRKRRRACGVGWCLPAQSKQRQRLLRRRTRERTANRWFAAADTRAAHCAWSMGCIFTKVCDEDDLSEVSGDKTQQMKQEAARRLSRAKSTLLIVEPREAAIANSSNPNNSRTPLKQSALNSDDPFLETTYYGGGIPGVALDAERVELSEFTGAREGGYKSVNGRLRWGTRSRSGNDPLRRRKENQDSFCVCDTLAEEKHLTFFSVFDGHGPEGAYVSHFVRELYHENLAESYAANVRRMSSSSRRASVSCDLITETFQQAARAVSEKLTDSTIDISVSGTTAVAMLVSDGDVFIANLGDSRAVVAQFSEPDDAYVLHCETRDHKPDVPEERQRIEANNGRVFEWGTFRVWLQDVDMPGLAMSRSFGDAVAKTVGVTCDPEVTIVEKLAFGRKERPSFVVLASDGVWEFMTSDECIDFVAQCILKSNMTPQEACDALVDEACERWNAEDDVVDDITAAIVYF